MALSLLTVGARAGELSMVYDQVMTTPKGSFTTKVWVKGNKKRTETERPSGQEITIIQGNSYIQIFPDLGIARRMSLAMDMSAGPMTSMPAEVNGEHRGPDGKVMAPVAAETVSNLPCKVYQLKVDNGMARVWVSEILPFPVKWEEEGFSYEIRNIKVSANIPDSLFKVPAGIRLMDEKLQDLPAEPAAGN
jgi:outer membrane lipoprotein-sorting protein